MEKTEGKYYTSVKEYMKDFGIIYDVDIDISYDEFRIDKAYKKLIKQMTELGLYKEFKDHIIFSLDFYYGKDYFKNFFDYDDDNTVFSYLLFLTLYNQKGLYVIYHEVTEEIFIVDEDRLNKSITESYSNGMMMSFISNILIDVKKIFLKLDIFQDIVNKKVSLDHILSEYYLFFKDVENLKFISKEFENCQLSVKFKGGEPFYMEAETKTDNVDFLYWKEALGSYRKIEENTDFGKVKSLKVVKKYKYGKDKEK